jgi:hypothetical protein
MENIIYWMDNAKAHGIEGDQLNVMMREKYYSAWLKGPKKGRKKGQRFDEQSVPKINIIGNLAYNPQYSEIEYGKLIYWFFIWEGRRVIGFDFWPTQFIGIFCIDMIF